MAHHEGLAPYPAELPPDTLRVVIAALRGNLPDVRQAAHMTWHVIGYALGQWDKHVGPAHAPPNIPDCPLTSAQAAAELERLQPPQTEGAQAALSASAFPWPLVLPVLIDLAAELLRRLLDRR